MGRVADALELVGDIVVRYMRETVLRRHFQDGISRADELHVAH